MTRYEKLYKKYTKKEILNGFLLFLDENLKNVDCEKVRKEGNWDCDRCDECMIWQYVIKYKNGKVPKINKL